MDKIIFLDIDGVLCTFTEYAKSKHDKRYGTRVYPFKKECVEQLNRIIENTGAKIVVSSSWRKLFSREHLQEIFDNNGVKSKILDITSGSTQWMSENNRSSEINAWINEHECKYCILDDLNLSEWFEDFVNTVEMSGLTKEDADKAIEILNS